MASTHDASKPNGLSISRTEVSRQTSTESPITTGSVSSPKFCQRFRSWRFKIAVLMQMSVVVYILLKVNIPIALVCMNRSATSLNTSAEASMATNTSSDSELTNSSLSQSNAEFQWGSSIQGLVLSSSGFLAFVTPPMTDWLSRHFGGKTVMQVGVLSSGLLTLLMPLGARMSPYILIVLRSLVGMAGGVVVPITSETFAWWAPEEEKVSLMSFVFLGLNVGNIMAGFSSGYLCSIPFDYGWPFIFYFHGALTVLWCVSWQLFGTIRPEDHRFISKQEKIHIIRTRLGMDNHQSGKKESPPYKEIAKSRPVWGFLLVMTMHHFATMLVFSYLPLYLSTVFGLGITEIGLLSSVGYVVRFIGVVLWGRLSNLLSMHTNVGPTAIRKIIQCSGYFVTASALVVLGFMEDPVVALCLLMVAMVFQSCTMVSGIVIPLDIAPRYASFLNGVFLTIASIVLVPGPIIASLMTSEGTLEQWRNLFLFVSAVFSLGGFSFLFLASAELQPWAIPKGRTAKEEMEQPLTPDLMTRRMTVLSAGPPLSPAPHQQRFNFTLTVEANSGKAWYNEENMDEADEESATGKARNTTIQAYTAAATATLKSTTINTHKNGGIGIPDSAHINLGFEPNIDIDHMTNNTRNAHVSPAFDVTHDPSDIMTSSRVSQTDYDIRNRRQNQNVESANVANDEFGGRTPVSNSNRERAGGNEQQNTATGKQITEPAENKPPKRAPLQDVRRARGLKLNIGKGTGSNLPVTSEVRLAHASDDSKSETTVADTNQEDPTEVTRL